MAEVKQTTTVQAIGFVKTVIGTVKAIDAGGVERTLQAGDKVYPNETIVTADGAQVLIEFVDSHVLTLPSHSSIVLDTDVFDPSATPPTQQLTVEQIQEMIARGEDPTAVTEATAAGAGAGDEGGSSFVVVGFDNAQGQVTSGFETIGIPPPSFPTLQQELPPEIAAGAATPGLPTDNGVAIVVPNALTLDEANLPTGTQPDAAAQTRSGTFTISAPDGVADVAIAGHSVISGGVFTPISFTTGLGNTVNVTGFNPVTGQFSYSYTLNGNAVHPDGDGNNSVSESLPVTLTDANGDSTSAALNIIVVDDVPHAVNDAASVPEAFVQDMNVAFVLDISGSIDDNELNTMMNAVKAAALQMFNSDSDVTVSVVAFSNTSLAFGPFTDYTSLETALNSLNPATGGHRSPIPGTDFTDAIQKTMATYTPVPDASNQVFFLSDGNPFGQLGSHGEALTDATAAAWQSFVQSNNINVTAIGIGDGINPTHLQEVDVDGVGSPIMVENFSELVGTLIPLVQSSSASGNVIDGVTGDQFGADGGHLLSIQVNTTAGLTTYTWDGNNTITLSGAQSGTINGDFITVTTQLGGMLTFYFGDQDGSPAGKWVYISPQNVNATSDDVFTYRIVDNDGDIAVGQLTITVEDTRIHAQPLVADRLLMVEPNVAQEGYWTQAQNSPYAAPAVSWVPAQATSGNVLNEAQSQANGVVAFANAMAVTVAGIDIAGAYGILHIDAAGDYTYTPKQEDLPTGASDTFNYVVQSTDGSLATKTLTVDIADHTYLPVGDDNPNVVGGGDGNDILSGLAGDDIVYGGAGDDVLNGDDGADHLLGGLGNDTLIGGAGNNVLEGNAGNDVLHGGSGNDILKGGEGNDILVGGDGDDLLIGGPGNDILTGGPGIDTFQWHAGDTGVDKITDFARGVGGDILDFSDLLQGEHANAVSLGSYLSFSFDGHNTVITIDADGAGPAPASQRVVLESVDLTANNTLPGSAIINQLLHDGNLRVDP